MMPATDERALRAALGACLAGPEGRPVPIDGPLPTLLHGDLWR